MANTTSGVIQFIDDRDPTIHFSGDWQQGVGVGQEFDDTTTSTTSAGAFLTIPFTGNTISVFGTIPALSDAGSMTSVSFSFDGGTAQINQTIPQSTPQYRVLLYSAGPSWPWGQHSLFVTNLQGGGQLIIDFFQVENDRANSAAGNGSSSTKTATTPVGAIVGGVVGGVVLLVLLGIWSVWFMRRRRRSAVLTRRTSFNAPLKDELVKLNPEALIVTPFSVPDARRSQAIINQEIGVDASESSSSGRTRTASLLPVNAVHDDNDADADADSAVLKRYTAVDSKRKYREEDIQQPEVLDPPPSYQQ